MPVPLRSRRGRRRSRGRTLGAGVTLRRCSRVDRRVPPPVAAVPRRGMRAQGRARPPVRSDELGAPTSTSASVAREWHRHPACGSKTPHKQARMPVPLRSRRGRRRSRDVPSRPLGEIPMRCSFFIELNERGRHPCAILAVALSDHAASWGIFLFARLFPSKGSDGAKLG